VLRPAWLIVASTFVAAWLALARAHRAGDATAPVYSPGASVLARMRGNRLAVVAVAALAALAAAAVLAPWLTPYGVAEQLDIIALKHRPPSGAHLFGTDQFGRDVFTRVLHGTRISLTVGVLSVLLAITIGTMYGAIAGFAGGRVDGAMMRVIDALLSIPRILILIAILSLWDRISVPFLVLLIGLTGWFGVSRLVRGQVLATRGQDFVHAARALGGTPVRLLARHILPNVLSPVVVAATLGVGNVIILEAGLSFLGIGVPQPEASWGNIILDGFDYLSTAWWVSLFPGLAIVTTVMACNIIGDALRDALDPRQVDGR
jgi:ABC-type dipeptide/oligopeptide/nickel transport system permease subunit